MKYFAVNEEIELTIAKIKREIMLSMNGICAENINNAGFNYRQNFGVSYARLTEIAHSYTQSYTLAYRLWLLPIRETKILATLLCPPDALTKDNIHEWIDAIDNSETAEIISYSLLSKVPHLTAQYAEMLSEDNHYIRLTAYHTLARIINQTDTGMVTYILEHIDTADLKYISAYRAIESLITNTRTINSNDIEQHIQRLMNRIRTNPTQYSNILLDTLC